MRSACALQETSVHLWQSPSVPSAATYHRNKACRNKKRGGNRRVINRPPRGRRKPRKTAPNGRRRRPPSAPRTTDGFAGTPAPHPTPQGPIPHLRSASGHLYRKVVALLPPADDSVPAGSFREDRDSRRRSRMEYNPPRRHEAASGRTPAMSHRCRCPTRRGPRARRPGGCGRRATAGRPPARARSSAGPWPFASSERR